jgi:DNA-binding IclR family transcriptional regulator
VIEGELLDFVRTSFRSVWTLELLLLMWRSRSAQWSAGELVRELRASDAIVSEGLASLQAAGLVSPEADGTFRYAPASPRLDLCVQQLAQVYRDRPTAVTRAIFSRQNDGLQTFADAFRLKKD